jgi:hypothetical protein
MGQPLVNNKNKKISELRGRDTITTYQDHSWLPLAQYNSRINSYHNVAINLKSITSYCNSYSTEFVNNQIDKLHHQYEDLEQLAYLGNLSYISDISYYINNSSIANTIIAYNYSYTKDYFEWQFL